MRENRKQIAHETLKIQQQGFYTAPSGKRVDIALAQKHSEENSHLITPEDGKSIIKSLTPVNEQCPTYEVINTSTVKAIIDTAKTNNSVAALNFASARNPGGGFLNGAMAQEEALAASSGLYSTQLCNEGYYMANRNNRSMMYTDYAIYSPDVVFFRNERFELLDEPVTASILTLPAVNMRQIHEKGEEINRAKQIMKERMRLALAIFAREGNKVIILGAYGCGVFGNDPNNVAQWWNQLLTDDGYGKFFEKILFVILDKPNGVNITPFQRIF